MLQSIYIVLTIFNLVLILVTAKKINFLIVYYLSSVIYYFNAIVGKIYIKNGDTIDSLLINENTYYVLIINMIVFLIMYTILLFYKKKKEEKDTSFLEDRRRQDVEKHIIFIGTILNVLVLIYCVFSMRGFLFGSDFNKVSIMNSTSRIQEYYKMFTMFWFLYLVLQYSNVKSKIAWIVAFSGLAFTFLVGHRSFVVITVIAAFVHLLNDKIWEKGNMISLLIKHKKIIVIGFLSLFIVFFVKGVYAALLNRDWELVFERLTNISYYTDTLKISEPNIIMSNLNGIIEADYELDKSSYAILPTYLIPGVTNWIGEESFTYIYQRDLYGTDNRASTILGEAYANGKLFMVFLICVILMGILTLFYELYNKNNSIIMKTFFLLSGIDVAFFVHRNSADYAVCRIRYYFYFVIIVFIIKIILNTWAKKVNRYEK